MQGFLLEKNDNWFVVNISGVNGISLHLGEIPVVKKDADTLLVYDNNRRIHFDMVGNEAVITRKFPKEHGLEWLSDSSEYPAD